MLDMDIQKEQEIKKMVSIVEQIDMPDILLLMRDANTLLMRKQEAYTGKGRMKGENRKGEKL